MKNLNFKQLILFSVLIILSNQAIAEKTNNYGRIYNVQDYINVTNVQFPGQNNDLLGIKRCFTEVAHRIYNMNSGNITIIFPQRIYSINDVIKPMSNAFDFPRNSINRFDINGSGRIQLNIIGLKINQNQVTDINTVGHIDNTFKKSSWVSYVGPNSNFTSDEHYNNGTEATADMNQFIDDNIPFNFIDKLLGDPEKHLISNPEIKPIIQSTNQTSHNFLKLTGTDNLLFYNPYQYSSPPTALLAYTSINIMGLTFEGIPNTTNTHIYDKNLAQHDQTFNMGTAIHLQKFKEYHVDNIIVKNIYGNGIVISNKYYAYQNEKTIVEKNIIENVWALKYRRTNPISYDDAGDGISFEGVNGGIATYNIVHNDIAVTKQYGRVGLATMSENNMNCTTSFNSVKGYDRGMHSENNLGGFIITQNRIVGSETGIVYDDNRDYGYYDINDVMTGCPNVNHSSISDNYISNEELPYNPDLQKLYPPDLFWAGPNVRTDVNNGTIIKNNIFVIDKNNIHNYTHNNYYPPNFPGDPRASSLLEYQPRYHIKSGIRNQEISCNIFKVLNPNNNAYFNAGGTLLHSFCPGEPDVPNPTIEYLGNRLCPSIYSCTLTNNSTPPISLNNNIYLDCDHLHLTKASSSLTFIGNNFINNQPNLTSDLGSLLTHYTKPITPPNPTCTINPNIPLTLTCNTTNVACNGTLGTITVNSFSSTPVTYAINPSATFQNGVFSGLNAGTYTVTATDANSNVATSVVIVYPMLEAACCNDGDINDPHIPNFPNIIVLQNPTSLNLIASFGSSIHNKSFIIDGVFNINEDITFSNCKFYMTENAAMQLSYGKTLSIYGSILSAACIKNMWLGIYADLVSSQVNLLNCQIFDMSSGIKIENNAIANIVSCHFTNNYENISIYRNTNSSNINITQNTFNSTGELKSPYELMLRPLHGIYLENCLDLTIGNLDDEYSGNSFNNLWNGITNIFLGNSNPTYNNPNSKVKLYNNKFDGIISKDNIYPAGQYDEVGSAIYSNRMAINGNTKLLVWNTANNFNTATINVNNCEKGIWLRKTTSDIKYNIINNTGFGIVATECEGQSYNINYNTMTNPYFGIVKIGDESTSGFNVSNNTINLANYGSYGLFNFFPSAIYSSYSSLQHLGRSKIINNTVNITDGSKAIGISIYKGLRDLILDNKVHFKTNATSPIHLPEMIGIYANTGDGVKFDNNIIDNNFSANQNNLTYVNNNNAGIYTIANINSHIGCNIINFTKWGIFAVGKNGNSTDYDKTVSNYMNCSDANFLYWKLVDEGTLGEKIGTDDQLLNIKYDANNFFIEPYNISNSNPHAALNKVFRVTDCLNNTIDKIVTTTNKLEQNESTANPGTQGMHCEVIVSSSVFTQTHSCASSTDPTHPNPIDVAKDVDFHYAMLVAGDSLSYSEFEEGGKRSSEELVYNWLKQNDSIRLSDPILDSFFLSQQFEIVGQLNQVDILIAQLSDSNLMANSTNWLNAIEAAKTANNLLSQEQVFETNAKWINNIYLKVLRYGKDTLSREEIDEIVVLANTCPYVGGNAVYRARTVLGLFQLAIHYDELSLCNGQGVYKNGTSKLQDQLNGIINYQNNKNQILTGNFKIYPIPADNQINIEYKFNENETANFILFDMLGRRRLQTQLIGDVYKTTLNVSNLETGVYLYQIQKQDNSFIKGKIIIE